MLLFKPSLAQPLKTFFGQRRRGLFDLAKPRCDKLSSAGFSCPRRSSVLPKRVRGTWHGPPLALLPRSPAGALSTPGMAAVWILCNE